MERYGETRVLSGVIMLFEQDVAAGRARRTICPHTDTPNYVPVTDEPSQFRELDSEIKRVHRIIYDTTLAVQNDPLIAAQLAGLEGTEYEDRLEAIAQARLSARPDWPALEAVLKRTTHADITWAVTQIIAKEIRE
jgi:hypothetical protein